MKEILIWSVLTLMASLAFLVTLGVGVKKKNLRMVLMSLGCLVLVLCLSVWIIFLSASKTYNSVTDFLAPRSGSEIYISLFGKATSDCVEILNYQDQVIPIIDAAIWLHFKTCPEELKRILSLHNFKREIVSTKAWHTDGPNAGDNRFNPESLGDSMLTYTVNWDEFGNGQYIYSSLDSTRAICMDVAD